MCAKKIENAGQVLVARKVVPDHTNGAVLIGCRQLTSKKTGKQHNVLQFDDGAEVIMPNGWQPYNFDLVIGNRYSACWADGKFKMGLA